jgi:hypothetical protein
MSTRSCYFSWAAKGGCNNCKLQLQLLQHVALLLCIIAAAALMV